MRGAFEQCTRDAHVLDAAVAAHFGALGGGTCALCIVLKWRDVNPHPDDVFALSALSQGKAMPELCSVGKHSHAAAAVPT